MKKLNIQINRIDAVKKFDYQAGLPGIRPKSSSFEMLSDAMGFSVAKGNVLNFMLPGDDLLAQLIEVYEIVRGKNYIVRDMTGNVYVGVINKYHPGVNLTIDFENEKYSQVILKEGEMQALYLIYQLSRPTPAYYRGVGVHEPD